jgi:hypothetical protein
MVLASVVGSNPIYASVWDPNGFSWKYSQSATFNYPDYLHISDLQLGYMNQGNIVFEVN